MARTVHLSQITGHHVIKTLFITMIVLNGFIILRNRDKLQPYLNDNQKPLWEQTFDFSKANFNNETGNKNGCYLVPNHIHFIRFFIPKVTYVEMICILAAFNNQKPDKIIFHRNHNTSFIGKYWNILESTQGFLDIVEYNYIALPTEIFGQSLVGRNGIHHGSDIARIQIMMKYGGIFLDNDVYVINSLDRYRRFEMTLNWDNNQFLGTQVLLAHKDARFLKLWLESYRGAYNKKLWYYNAGERPTKTILWKMPKLIHRVKILFGVDIKFINLLYQVQWKNWKRLKSLHLLIHHQYLLQNLTENATFPVEFNENNIGYYPVTFRDMAYEVYHVANITWPKLYLCNTTKRRKQTKLMSANIS